MASDVFTNEEFQSHIKRMVNWSTRESSWIIWSREHQGWWRSNKIGYTQNLRDAGRYSYEEALNIVQLSNEYAFGDIPEELMCPDFGQ